MVSKAVTQAPQTVGRPPAYRTVDRGGALEAQHVSSFAAPMIVIATALPVTHLVTPVAKSAAPRRSTTVAPASSRRAAAPRPATHVDAMTPPRVLVSSAALWAVE